MKRMTQRQRFAMLIAAMLLGSVACADDGDLSAEGTDADDSDTTSHDTDNNDTESESPPAGGVLLKSELPRETAPVVTDDTLVQLTAANTAFAADMYAQLCKDNEDNLFFSPFSLSAGFAMQYGGANGTTEAEMGETLHFADFSDETLHTAFNRLLLDLKSREVAKEGDDSGFELSIANSFFAQKDFPFLSDYLDLLSVNYGAGIYTMDFSGDLVGSVQTVNDWIADNTEDHLTDVLDANDLTPPIYSILVNAMYFKAAWNIPFKTGDTTDQDFTLLSGDTVTIPTMAQGEHFAYGAGDGYQAVALRYDGELVDMVLIAPDTGTFTAFEEGLDGSKIGDILQNMASPYQTWVTLTMPRFQIASKWEMKDMFVAMGMETPFTEDADFSGMSSQFLRIQKIIHQTEITVDEAGTEAAAATVIVDANGDSDYATVNLNRPFIFLVRDILTGTVLFMGRVTNPGL